MTIRFIAAISSISFALSSCLAFDDISIKAAQSASMVEVKFKPEEMPLSDGFGYPIGNGEALTPKKDGDGWYIALGFNHRRHLGEDWNAESGGNSDCGEPVLAASTGVVIFAADIGGGWGSVLLIRHLMPNGSEAETLYGHVNEFYPRVGDVVHRGDTIGVIGDAEPPCGDGHVYSAHLHFEIRVPECRYWGRPGEGYSDDAYGWVEPTEFIEQHERL